MISDYLVMYTVGAIEISSERMSTQDAKSRTKGILVTCHEEM